jgi:hypothetical protein
MRRVLAILTLTTALFGLGAFPAVAGGPNNYVTSDATVDLTGADMFVTNSSLVVGSTGTDEVTSTNVARAYAHDCNGCQAVSVAFQAVLTTGHPHVVTPHNFAIAVNERCNGCVAVAWAFQYVVATDGPERLSPAGRLALAAVRQDVADTLAADLTLDEFITRMNAAQAKFQQLVDDDIRRRVALPSFAVREALDQVELDRRAAGA